jgi:uncharacterized membrane protein
MYTFVAKIYIMNINIWYLTFAFIVPAIIILLCQKISFLGKIGTVVLAYIAGLIVGNLYILPDNISDTQELVNIITIPIAIPLLLFSLDIKKWFRLAGKTALALLIAILSVIIVVVAGYFIFNDGSIKELWKIAGLLITVYIGGTANMAALKIMLNINPDDYILTHTYDMLMSSVYLLFLITIARKVFLLVLPPFKKDTNKETELSEQEQFESYAGIFKPKTIINLLFALLISVIIFIIGYAISLLVGEHSQMAVIVLSITTLGIFSSLIPRIKRIEKTFEAGMFFILVFSFNVSTMADIHRLIHFTPSLLYYITWAIFGSLILQVLISAIFKIDVDTVIITSNALINSAPFVPMVASSLKNKEIIISGITVGIIGYATGNYLGYLIALALSYF